MNKKGLVWDEVLSNARFVLLLLFGLLILYSMVKFLPKIVKNFFGF